MTFYNFLKAYIGPLCTNIASLCSIVGLVLLFINDKTACIIALIVFCIGLIVILYGILKVINKLLTQVALAHGGEALLQCGV